MNNNLFKLAIGLYLLCLLVISSCEEAAIPIEQDNTPVIVDTVSFPVIKTTSYQIPPVLGNAEHLYFGEKDGFKYLYNFEKIKDNPAMHLRTPKTDKNLPVIVRENDIVSLMEEPIKNPITNEIEGERDHAILEMLYATGLRLSELLSINICDIDRKSELVKVMGKGGKERIVPIGKVALNSIESYLKKLGKSIRSSYEDPLFVNKKGKRLPKRTLQERIRKYLEATMGGGTAHTLRHTFATHLVNSGADILTVKELLGHSSLSSTQHYTRLNLEKIKKVYQEKHPHGK